MGKDATAQARFLRRSQTVAEKKFWAAVRDRRFKGLKFRRQVPIGPYIADFACLEIGLIVELDGGQHNESPSDVKRDVFMNGHGFKLKRYWNNEVINNMDGVLEDLGGFINTLTPTLSLKGEGVEGVVS